VRERQHAAASRTWPGKRAASQLSLAPALQPLHPRTLAPFVQRGVHAPGSGWPRAAASARVAGERPGVKAEAQCRCALVATLWPADREPWARRNAHGSTAPHALWQALLSPMRDRPRRSRHVLRRWHLLYSAWDRLSSPPPGDEKTKSRGSGTATATANCGHCTLYWLLNFLLTYWFMSDVLPTLQNKTSQSRDRGQQRTRGGGGRRRAGAAAKRGAAASVNTNDSGSAEPTLAWCALVPVMGLGGTARRTAPL
jgi:hypothetical protein